MEAPRPWTLLLAASLLVAVVPATLGPADATTTPADPTIIVGEETWTEDREIDRQVTVAPGATLTIRGAEITWTATTCVDLQGGVCVNELIVEDGGTLVLEDATVAGVAGQNPLSIGIGGEIDATDSRLSELGMLSLSSDTAKGTFVGNDIGPMVSYISVGRSVDLTFEDNHVHDAYAGLWGKDGSPVIRGNLFERIGYYGVIHQQSLVGGKITTSAPVIEDNTFHNVSSGVTTDTGGGAQIRGNVFSDVEHYPVNFRIPSQDFMLDQEPPTVEGNVFDGTDVGIRVYTVSRATTDQTFEVEVHGNSFLGITRFYIQAEEAPGADLVVDATGNWWGSSSGPETGDLCPESDHSPCEPFRGSGEIIYDPWLNAAP